MKLPGLKEVRELHGWSQAKLSEEAGVSRDSISNYETGHREAWPATAKRLADALGVEIEELVHPKAERRSSPEEVAAAATEIAEQVSEQAAAAVGQTSEQAAATASQVAEQAAGAASGARKIAEKIDLPSSLDSRNIVDIVRAAELADTSRNAQMFTRLEESREPQTIYGSVPDELERRLSEHLHVDPQFFGTMMYSALWESVRRLVRLEEENARLREEAAKLREQVASVE